MSTHINSNCLKKKIFRGYKITKKRNILFSPQNKKHQKQSAAADEGSRVNFGYAYIFITY